MILNSERGIVIRISDPDGLPGFWQSLMAFLLLPLCIVFNYSLITGILHSLRKHSFITPIYKLDTVSKSIYRMMLLIGLLATASLFMVVNSAPTMFTTNQREKDVDNDHLLLVFLLNRRDGALKPMPFDSGNDSGPAHLRNKRIGSLSIVNSIEVLRDRVLLELARRKAMQDQRQINENRKLMDQIGKRSYVNPAAGSTGPQTDKSIFSKINLDEPNEITYHEGQSKKLPTQIPCESCPDLLRPENDPLQRLLLVL